MKDFWTSSTQPSKKELRKAKRVLKRLKRSLAQRKSELAANDAVARVNAEARARKRIVARWEAGLMPGSRVIASTLWEEFTSTGDFRATHKMTFRATVVAVRKRSIIVRASEDVSDERGRRSCRDGILCGDEVSIPRRFPDGGRDELTVPQRGYGYSYSICPDVESGESWTPGQPHEG